jgi:arginine decarboxylase
MNTSWSTDDARRTYSIANWGEDYFDIGNDGGVTVRPRRHDGPTLSLPQIVAAAREYGSRLPLLVRFADILNDRRARLQAAFAKAMSDWEYAGGYTAIYPISRKTWLASWLRTVAQVLVWKLDRSRN